MFLSFPSDSERGSPSFLLATSSDLPFPAGEGKPVLASSPSFPPSHLRRCCDVLVSDFLLTRNRFRIRFFTMVWASEG